MSCSLLFLSSWSILYFTINFRDMHDSIEIMQLAVIVNESGVCFWYLCLCCISSWIRSICLQVMPLSEAFYLSWFKRRASMSASELLATPRMLSSSVQAALTLKSPTSTRASIPQLRGVPLVPTVLWPLVPLYNSPSQQIWPHYPYQCIICGTFLVSPFAIDRPNAD